MDYLILYRTQDYYYLVDKEIVKNGHGDRIHLIHESEFSDTSKCYSEVFSKMGYDSSGYYSRVLFNDLIYLEKNTFFSYIARRLVNRKNYIDAIVSKFRLVVRQQLFDLLGDKNFSISDILSAFKKYTMQDEYTLWVFNQDTEVYTPISSSYSTECEYIRKGDETRFDDFLQSGDLVEEGNTIKSKHAEVESRGNLWRTWIRLDLGLDGQPAILAFYSKYEGFGIQKSVIRDIKQLVELRYNSDARISYKDLHQSVQELIQIEGSEPLDILNKVAYLLKNVLKYEASSSFIYNEGKENIVLVSTYDNTLSGGLPDEEVVYKKGIESLTMKSCSNKDALLIVYDINIEENSNIYDEDTESDPVNWVGMPICLNGKLYGFVRAKNKFTLSGSKKIITAPSPLDHFNLMALRAFVEAILEVVNRNTELVEKLRRHDNVAKVFMHEIRGPVGSIASIPNQVIDQIYELDCGREQKEKIVSKLEDVSSLANVLSFIVQATDVEHLLGREYLDESVSILKDLIIPADKLLRNYFSTQYESKLIFDHDSLRGAHVVGSDKLLMMVLFALLDNAGKYQFEESGPIRIYGEYKENGKFVNVFIENHGIEIKEYETSKILERDYRGDNARNTGAHGSGIGLWLCDEIARKFGGEISVDNRFSPVRFRLKLLNSRGAT